MKSGYGEGAKIRRVSGRHMLHGLIAAVLAVDVIRVRSGVPGEGGEREGEGA